jgi:hypothetical protein
VIEVAMRVEEDDLLQGECRLPVLALVDVQITKLEPRLLVAHEQLQVLRQLLEKGKKKRRLSVTDAILSPNGEKSHVKNKTKQKAKFKSQVTGFNHGCNQGNWGTKKMEKRI